MPSQPAPSVAVKALEWKEDGKYLRARMGDREYSLNITSDGETWAGCTRPYVFGHNLTWSSVPNCSMVSLEQAKAACQADCQSRYAALSAQVQDVAGLEVVAKAAQDYVDAVSGEPEKDCWDTEDGKEAPGAIKFASDFAWRNYDIAKQRAFDNLRAALAAAPAKQEGGE